MEGVERWSTRSDAWTPSDDERLAEIVLRHIRTGSTQLKAFEEAAAELGRTAAACGYRWNGVLRKERRDDIELAKKERKSAQNMSATNSSYKEPTPFMTMTASESMQDVIKFLQAFDAGYQKLRQQLEQVESERDELATKVRELEAQLARNPVGDLGPVTVEQLEQDSKTLFAIMERARKLLDPDLRGGQKENDA
ncbi:MAG: RsfA family transcriptional regulator [Alicyclobacillus herbarius]|uniref:transcriptional regulator n=1 Tax=Alicyclobacillus herbarius TaxID=122960 RepID=UPI0003FEB666|nr:transcriptional regulator [Alicyclobacillus herbarius]MCL6631357.1 RsfA family transcriptional regulator [Alicyclobacillus herbarius]